MGQTDSQPGHLNPALWRGKTLLPEVRDRLLKIADDFLKDAKPATLRPLDIVVTGSNANLNWKSSSDIDLHMVVDVSKVGCPEDVAVEYLYDMTALWNEHHQIFMHGHQVELYLQDSKEKTPFSAGVYSLLHKKWIQEPVRVTDPDSKIVKKKADVLAAQILKLITKPSVSHETLGKIEALRNRLRTMRHAGLAKSGEHSVENLVFKELRGRGLIDRMKDAARGMYDTLMSLREHYVGQGNALEASTMNFRATRVEVLLRDLETLAAA